MMASGLFFFTYFADVEEKGAGRLRDLFVAAVLLGLAGLAKYNAGFMGVAVLAAVLFRPKLRLLLKSWPIYAAGALTLGMQAPVLIWNMQHGFASFGFHAAGRFGGGHFTGLNWSGMRGVAVDTATLLGWFMIPTIVSFFLRRPADAFQRVGKTIAIITFWLSSLLFLYIANFAWVMWWWNIAAFVLIIPFIGRTIGWFMLSLHTLWGLVVISAVTLSYAIMPVTMLFGGRGFNETEAGFGWDRISAAVASARDATGADFLATNRYQLSSQLAFALDDSDITAISPRRDAFDDWWSAEAHLGQDAVVLVDGRDDADYWRASFANFRLVEELVIEKFGYKLATYQVYFAEGYSGEGPPVPVP
jgi:hypothetical protein